MAHKMQFSSKSKHFFAWTTITSFRSMGLTAVTFLALGVAGCSTNTTLTNGASLSKAGQVAATQMNQAVTLSSGSVSSLKMAVAFNDGYSHVAGNTNSSAFLDNISNIQLKLNKYGDWLQSLSSAYSALGDLAGYDAVGNFDTAIASLASDTTNFASAIGKQVVIPSDATVGVQQIGGLVVGAVQAHEVKVASRNIMVMLTNVISMLEDPAIRNQLVTIHGEVNGQIDIAANVLFDNNIGSYLPLLDQIGAPLGIKSISDADKIAASNTNILAGLRNVALENLNEQISAQASTYDKSVAALKALVPLHHSLDNNEPVNLNTISSIITQLQGIAASFSTIRK